METSKLLETIYDDECQTPCAYVEVMTTRADDEHLLSVLKFMNTLEYNNFNGKKVVPFLKRLIKNGEIATLRFGREYSPVLYLKISCYDCKNERQLTRVEFLQRKTKIEDDFKGALLADETSYSENVLRAWFD